MKNDGRPAVRTHLWRAESAAARDAFHGVLLREAAAKAATIPQVVHFSVNAVFDSSHRLMIAPGPLRVDAISHLTFSSAQQRQEAEASREYWKLQELLRPFLQSSVALDVTQRVFAPPPRGSDVAKRRAQMLKRMSILQRSASLGAEEFQRLWEEEHGPRVAGQGGGQLRGYLQDSVVACKTEYGETQPNCDGLTELWFEDYEGMENVLPSSMVSDVTSNAARIIGSISTFLVREIELF
jgi:hypothetical protein